ncbi:MAG: hydrogenase maturation protease [Acidimicrobiales bacterium]
MEAQGRVLVAGVGNIFLGDDGWGVEVARRLADVPLPEGVRVADFGIRGVHLAYELLDGYDTLVLVDALGQGEAPGTLSVIEPEVAPAGRPDGGRSPVMDAHGMDPGSVLGMLADLGGKVGRVLLVGCEPAVVEEGIGLSGPVAEAVAPGVEMVKELVGSLPAPTREEGSS